MLRKAGMASSSLAIPLVAAALLNVEFGCITYASWAMQRKLEFKFRLSRMPSGRLPAMVSRCQWRGASGACHASASGLRQRGAGLLAGNK